MKAWKAWQCGVKVWRKRIRNESVKEGMTNGTVKEEDEQWKSESRNDKMKWELEVWRKRVRNESVNLREWKY